MSMNRFPSALALILSASDIPSSESVNKLDIDQSWGIDLDELRLVQFGADEAPV